MLNKAMLGVTLACGLLGASIGYAEQTKETIVCGKSIDTVSARFYKKVYKGVAVCLKGVSKCASDPTCIGKLLVLDKGKCAMGKLDEGVEYFGIGAGRSFAHETNESKIGKAHYKFVEGLGKKCFLPGVDLSTGVDGLGYNPTPVDRFELHDHLNRDDVSGVACSAHHDLLNAFPDRDALIGELFNHPLSAHMAIGLLYIYFYPSACR